MDKNTVLALNNVIYQIYNTEEFEEMKKNLLISVSTLVPNACGSILMAADSGSETLLCDPVCFPERFVEMEKRYMLLEKRDYGRWIMQRKQTTIITASSMMSDEERRCTELYRACFSPFGLHYSVDVTIVHKGEFLGVIALYRREDEGDFTEDEIFIMENLSDHLNVRFYNELKKRENPANKNHMGFLIKKYGLTAREAEILRMVFSEKTNGEICSELYISNNTLKKHLQNIYRKTGVPNRIGLMGISCL